MKAQDAIVDSSVQDLKHTKKKRKSLKAEHQKSCAVSLPWRTQPKLGDETKGPATTSAYNKATIVQNQVLLEGTMSMEES